MRKDFFKILTERARSKSFYSYKYKRRISKFEDFENLSSKEPMKSRVISCKEFSENLSPLIRFLQKNVGKNWNDIYSEIRETLNMNKTTHKHLLDHVKWSVCTSPMDEERNERGYFMRSKYSNNFYVDFNGILKQY